MPNILGTRSRSVNQLANPSALLGHPSRSVLPKSYRDFPALVSRCFPKRLWLSRSSPPWGPRRPFFLKSVTWRRHLNQDICSLRRYCCKFRRITPLRGPHGNSRKNDQHGVSLAEAERVFFNTPVLLLPDPAHSQTEPRYHALGKTINGRRLHVTFTLRDGGKLIRVIAAREMRRTGCIRRTATRLDR